MPGVKNTWDIFRHDVVANKEWISDFGQALSRMNLWWHHRHANYFLGYIATRSIAKKPTPAIIITRFEAYSQWQLVNPLHKSLFRESKQLNDDNKDQSGEVFQKALLRGFSMFGFMKI